MEIRINEPMKGHTSFRAGGAAKWFVIPENREELAAAAALFQKAGISWYALGNGSNLLVSDRGFDGAIISMEKFEKLEVCGSRIIAGAGVLLSRTASKALNYGLTGLEFAAGIPGSVGGAVTMNAGAYGSEMKDVLKTVTVLDRNGEVRVLKAGDMELGYRTSAVSKKGYLVLEAEFELLEGSAEAIKARMEELSKKRREKQPLEYPSAGSTFKRPEGHFAGQLIEAAGLKGYSVGGASVSEKHAGFVINRKDASAEDIYRLCMNVKKQVLEQSGVLLELEVKLLGTFEEDR